MYCDTHMHTSFSFDSETPPEEQIKKAISLKIPRICITDHQDYIYPDEGQPYLIDLDKYFDVLGKLRDKYADSIQVDIGVEMGCQLELAAEMERVSKKYPFDFIIGSTHFAEGKDPYYNEYFEGRSNEDGFRAFFERILANLEVYDDFDTLGHIDYVTRYGIENNGTYIWSDYRDIFAAIMEHLIKKDICLEVNTAGFKAGLGRPNPRAEVLSFYRELGGSLITLGADGHKPEHIAYSYELIGELLKNVGFNEYMVFKGRKPEAYPL